MLVLPQMTNDDMLKDLLRGLLAEGWRIHAGHPERCASKRHLLRTLMNIRPPLPARPERLHFRPFPLGGTGFGTRYRPASAAHHPGSVWGRHSIPNHLVLWEGRHHNWGGSVARAKLKAARLLRAAPPCIDNAIHSAAGIQVRLEARAYGRQGPTAVGQAKLTRGTTCPLAT